MNFYKFCEANFYKFLVHIRSEANFNKFLCIILSLVLIWPAFNFAQDLNATTSITLTSTSTAASTEMNILQERRALEQELKKLEEQIAQYDEDLQKTRKEKNTLQNKIYTLRNKIKKLDLRIHQSNLIIKDLNFQIADTKASIQHTTLRVENLRQNLIYILRAVYEEDQKTLVEILLSEQKLSGFFDNLVALEALNARNQEVLEQIKALKTSLQQQRQSLDEERESLGREIAIHTLQRKQQQQAEQEKKQLLKLTEAEYQKYLEKREKAEKRVQKIRSQILELIGVREAPTYEKAIEVAKYVSELTGIRPAFLLGILTQESNIGKNVGQCFLQDSKTGMGIKFNTDRKWPRVMKPNWIPLFLKVIKELNQTKGLNLDPFATPISCWIAACVNQNYHVTYNVSVDSEGKITCPRGYVPFGWGGAMGPAQLMPFNWLGSDKYKNKIEAITGKMADPWDFSDSALGAALHLKDCGALENERKAAACYFGGWRNRNTSYHLRAYADPVLWLSECHQKFIDTNSMSLECEERIF